MLKKDLIKQCRYYNGEKECPKTIEEKSLANIWDYEKMWVESAKLRDENGYNTLEYIGCSMKDFNTEDGTPVTLKALLYNRHTHWTGGYGIESDTKNFKEWYINSYLKHQQYNK